MTAALTHISFRRIAAGHYAAGAFEIVRRGPLWTLTHADATIGRYTTLDDAKTTADDMAGNDAIDLFSEDYTLVDEHGRELDPETQETVQTAATLIVVPCAAAKLDHKAPARDLYTSANFRHTLRGAEAEAAATARDLGTPARVVILSALHGIVELDTALDPYDVRMGDAASVTPATIRDQLERTGARTVVAMLPADYRDALRAATDEMEVDMMDAYEGTRGIGDQRAVAAAMARNADTAPTNAAIVALIKAQIRDDIADGLVPATVTRFADLHDHVDANTYGDPLVIQREQSGDDWHDVANAVHADVDAWLRAGRPDDAPEPTSAALFDLDAAAPSNPDVQAADQAAADAKESADTAEHVARNGCPQMAAVGTRRHMEAAMAHAVTAAEAADRAGTRDARQFADRAAAHANRAAAAFNHATNAAGRQEFNREAPLTETRTWDELDDLERNQWIATADANTPKWIR